MLSTVQSQSTLCWGVVSQTLQLSLHSRGTRMERRLTVMIDALLQFIAMTSTHSVLSTSLKLVKCFTFCFCCHQQQLYIMCYATLDVSELVKTNKILLV